MNMGGAVALLARLRLMGCDEAGKGGPEGPERCRGCAAMRKGKRAMVAAGEIRAMLGWAPRSDAGESCAVPSEREFQEDA